MSEAETNGLEQSPAPYTVGERLVLDEADLADVTQSIKSQHQMSSDRTINVFPQAVMFRTEEKDKAAALMYHARGLMAVMPDLEFLHLETQPVKDAQGVERVGLVIWAESSSQPSCVTELPSAEGLDRLSRYFGEVVNDSLASVESSWRWPEFE